MAGALYFNSTANEMRVYDGANWIAATSAGNVSLLEYKYTATSGQTTFSGADDSANTLSYTQNNLIVTLNGVVLENGTDYTATTGTSVVLASGAATSDELNVIAFKSFTTADMVSSANGGTFYNNIDVQGTVTSDGLTVDGNATINDNFPYILLNESDTTDLNTRISVGSGYFNLNTLDDAYTVAKQRFRLDNSTGDISFYEDTGTTAKFFWDASAESLGIGTSSPSEPLDVAGGKIRIGNTKIGHSGSGGNWDMTFETYSGGYFERMRIDSSGNVGIGVSSIQASAAGKTLETSGCLISGGTLNSHQTNRAVIEYNVGSNAMNIRAYGATAGSGIMTFATGGGGGSADSEAMRIDSSGNLLVSATTTSGFQSSSSESGTIAYAAGGIASNSPSNDVAGVFNRLGNAGAIVQLKDDGTTVGQLLTGSGGYMHIIGGNNTFGSGIALNNQTWNPTNASGTITDNLVKLGDISSRFTDLYLSGGVYLGGTGASNQLSDYEEGTWTPTFTNTGTATLQYARYVKIGNTVSFWVRVGFASGVSANSSYFSLPFASTTMSSGTWTRGTIEGGFVEPQVGASCYFSSAPSGYSGLFIIAATYSTQ